LGASIPVKARCKRRAESNTVIRSRRLHKTFDGAGGNNFA
jgi:hypothetical protein